MREEQRERCHKALERTREAREKQSLMYAKLKPLSPTKTSPGKETAGERGKREGRKSQRSMAEAEDTRVNIDSFEAQLRTMPAVGVSVSPPAGPATVSEPSVYIYTSGCLFELPSPTAGWARRGLHLPDQETNT